MAQGTGCARRPPDGAVSAHQNQRGCPACQRAACSGSDGIVAAATAGMSCRHLLQMPADRCRDRLFLRAMWQAEVARGQGRCGFVIVRTAGLSVIQCTRGRVMQAVDVMWPNMSCGRPLLPTVNQTVLPSGAVRLSPTVSTIVTGQSVRDAMAMTSSSTPFARRGDPLAV